jgi:hypothetical protein
LEQGELSFGNLFLGGHFGLLLGDCWLALPIYQEGRVTASLR